MRRPRGVQYFSRRIPRRDRQQRDGWWRSENQIRNVVGRYEFCLFSVGDALRDYVTMWSSIKMVSRVQRSNKYISNSYRFSDLGYTKWFLISCPKYEQYYFGRMTVASEHSSESEGEMCKDATFWIKI